MGTFHWQELSETGPAWEALLTELLAEAPGRKVMDAGCGTGFLALLLARCGWQVTAVDSSAEMIQQGRLAASEMGLAERIVFQVSDAQAGAQTDCTFDAIVSRHASWLFPEPAAAYREWTRLLRPGGILLNMDANWLLPLWKTDISAQFWKDEAELICRYGEFQDCYHDKDLMQAFQQLPLAFQSRPAWDEHICRELGLLRVEGRLLKPEIYWNPFLAIRYRTVPTFVICAQKSIK